MKHLKELQQRNTERVSRPESAEPFKLSRFKNVESHVRKTLQDWGLRESSGEERPNSRPSTAHTFTRKGEGVAKFEDLAKSRFEEARKLREGSRTTRKPPVPKLEEYEDMITRRHSNDEIDFLKKNAIAVIKSSAAASPDDKSKALNARFTHAFSWKIQ